MLVTSFDVDVAVRGFDLRKGMVGDGEGADGGLAVRAGLRFLDFFVWEDGQKFRVDHAGAGACVEENVDPVSSDIGLALDLESKVAAGGVGC